MHNNDHKIKLYVLCWAFCVTAANELVNFSEGFCDGNNRVKIVGGGDASPGEFPWLVSLMRRGNHFCGGSLITRRHVLTAAHCVCNGADDIIKPLSIRITAGQHDLSAQSNAQEMAVTSIAAHPGYKCSKARNDIAILELDSDVAWSDSVRPACLSTKFVEGDEEDDAVVAGWGRTSENITDPNAQRTGVLQKARVAILNNDVCRGWYQSQGKKTKITDAQLCAGRKEGGVDACWADSGGPLMLEDESIVGVVSTGIGCGRPLLPGIYTRVSEFLPWIHAQVEQSNAIGLN